MKYRFNSVIKEFFVLDLVSAYILVVNNNMIVNKVFCLIVTLNYPCNALMIVRFVFNCGCSNLIKAENAMCNLILLRRRQN